MVIEINGKEVELKFGIAFLRYVDSNSGLVAESEQAGQPIKINTRSNGFESLLGKMLRDKDETALADIIFAGSRRSKRKPNMEEIEEHIEGLYAQDERDGTNTYEELIIEVYEGLKTQPSARRMKMVEAKA